MNFKKVLYISYDGLTDPLGQSQILPYVQELSKRGYQFTILSFEKRARFAREESTIRAITAKHNIRWIPLFFTAKPPVVSKMYDRFQMERTTMRLFREHRFDMLHCRSYIAAEMGLKLKQKLGVPFLFDMRGFWADEKVDNGQWDLKKALYKRIYKHYKDKEAQFLLEAAGIVSLTEAAKEYLLHKPAYKHLVIDVIPCCADLEHFNFQYLSEKETSEKKRSLGIPEPAKVMVYLGSIGGWYMTREIFRFFSILQKRFPDYVLLLLTKDDAEMVKKEAMNAGVPKEKLFISYCSRQQLPLYLGFCTASVFFIRNTFSKMASSPTKHAELMGMGIPVICNTIGDTAHVINSTESGVIVDDFSDPSFEQVVSEYPGLLKISKEHIRQGAFENFDLYAGAQQYLNIYQRILKP